MIFFKINNYKWLYKVSLVSFKTNLRETHAVYSILILLMSSGPVITSPALFNFKIKSDVPKQVSLSPVIGFSIIENSESSLILTLMSMSNGIAAFWGSKSNFKAIMKLFFRLPKTFEHFIYFSHCYASN